MPAPTLSAAIVTYRPDARLFGRALASLAAAILEARKSGELAEARLVVIDNGPAEAQRAVVEALAAWPEEAGTYELVAGHGNVGYGRANNLALARVRSEFHLILNPAVELDPSALREALRAAREHPEVGLVAPAVFGDDGERQYLCKRYPSVWVLFLRGFAPSFLRRRFQRSLDHYEMRDAIAERFVPDIPLASGCFMAIRTPLFERLGGFDARYFMYFEDYDLSLRLAPHAALAYAPEARIVHHGGNASAKGLRHVAWFLGSAWRFFSRHGWRRR